MKFNGRNTNISANALIGSNVKIGDNCTIYDNVEIGDNSIIANDCVIGEPLNDYYFDKTYENPKTIIKSNSIIRSHCILYAGSTFGEYFSTGHRVTIREKSVFGKHCRVGTLSDIQGHCTFGDYNWLHSNVHIGQGSSLGHFIFIYPYVILTNDPTPPSDLCLGPIIDNFAQIAVSSVLLPGVKIGKHALVGAGSIVSHDVDPYSLVVGNPAKRIKDVREIKNKKDGGTQYPWPERFDRGMPWSEMGFEKWAKEQNDYDL